MAFQFQISEGGYLGPDIIPFTFWKVRAYICNLKIGKTVRRGEIYSYDFGTTEGSIQSGRRPVLVIQADNFNEKAPTVIVASITTVIKKRYLPSHIILGRPLWTGETVNGSFRANSDGK